MIIVDIRKAFTQQIVNELSGTYEIAYQNVNFAPTADIYLQEQFTPNFQDVRAIGKNPCFEEVGFYQLLVYSRLDTGLATTETAIADIHTAFKVSDVISYNTTEVTITSVDTAPGFILNDWYVTPVTINYSAYGKNN